MKNKFELAIWITAEMGKQHVRSGENNFGMMLEAVLEHSVVDIGVEGAVGFSPDSPLGLKHTFPQPLGALMAIKS